MTTSRAKYKRRWRKRRKAQGLCTDCPRISLKYPRCSQCRRREAARLAKQRAQQKQEEVGDLTIFEATNVDVRLRLREQRCPGPLYTV